VGSPSPTPKKNRHSNAKIGRVMKRLLQSTGTAGEIRINTCKSPVTEGQIKVSVSMDSGVGHSGVDRVGGWGKGNPSQGRKRKKTLSGWDEPSKRNLHLGEEGNGTKESQIF